MSQGEQPRKRVRTRCDRESRQADAVDRRLPLVGLRHPGDFGAYQIRDQPDHGHRLIGETPDAKTPYFKQAGELLCGTHEQPAMTCLDMGAVIGD
jgi:hypothetical protein